MASHHVVPTRISATDLSSGRLHLGRVLALLVTLIGVLTLILVLLAGAA